MRHNTFPISQTRLSQNPCHVPWSSSQSAGAWKPRVNTIHSGLGAFELGLRYEKLWSRGVVDGEASAVTGGLTWFAHKHIKVPFNLVYTQTPVWNETTLVVRFQASG
ncbi:MAG: phosphate-selective porin [Myxococcota bacterium]|jgi:phosphate-selective porin